jgi:hypothetical protein
MPRLTLLLALAAALVGTAGCRDVLVDPPPTPANPDAPGAPSMYLKGPTTLLLAAEAGYRAEPVAGVHHYEWRSSGEGYVALRFPAGDTRLPVGVADTPGTLQLIVEARDAEGRVLARGTKTVTIR